MQKEPGEESGLYSGTSSCKQQVKWGSSSFGSMGMEEVWAETHQRFSLSKVYIYLQYFILQLAKYSLSCMLYAFLINTGERYEPKAATTILFWKLKLQSLFISAVF